MTWSVLCGITLVAPNSPPLCLSIATGTKCEPPPSSPEARQWTVLDSHAEVLARRGLVLVLVNELTHLLNNPSSYISPILHKPDSSSKYCLRGALEMFVTDAPCGHAAEFARVGHQSTRESGAKPLSSASRVRLKPGRSDLPAHLVTKCMSCSDKLCLWTVCGLQGRLLAKHMDWAYLSRIHLGHDALAAALEKPDGQVTDEAVDLVVSALRANLSRAVGGTQPEVLACPEARFDRARAQPSGGGESKRARLAPTDVGVSWVADSPGGRWHKRKRVAGGWVQVLVKGRLQGASKPVTRETASDLSRGCLVERLAEVLGEVDADREYLLARLSFLHEKEFAEWVGNR